jgi:hypothetical protein
MSSEPRTAPAANDDWRSDWESARREQLRRFRDLPMIEKFRAVEEMCRLARMLADARRKGSAGPSRS